MLFYEAVQIAMNYTKTIWYNKLNYWFYEYHKLQMFDLVNTLPAKYLLFINLYILPCKWGNVSLQAQLVFFRFPRHLFIFFFHVIQLLISLSVYMANDSNKIN